MSDSRSSYYYSEESQKIKDSPCITAPDKKHDWEQHGSWPSTWYKCRHCSDTRYNK